MRSQLLEERKDQIIMLTQKGVVVKRKTAYNLLKYGRFNGERIKYRFSETIFVEETFEDGIFNCTHIGDQVQSTRSNEVARAIMEHQETGSAAKFAELFYKSVTEKNLAPIVKFLLSKYSDRLRFDETARVVIIDDTFMVDTDARAYLIEDEEKSQIKGIQAKRNIKKLCVVVHGHKDMEAVRVKMDSRLGQFLLDEKDLTMLGKIFFLLNPDLKDDAFRTQLPSPLLEQLKRKKDNNKTVIEQA